MGNLALSFTVSEIRLLYLEFFIRNCGETPADGDMVTVDSL